MSAIGGPDARRERDSETVRQALGVLRRRWLILLVAVVACGLAGVVKHRTGTAQYQATASVAFGTADLTSSAFQVNTSTVDPARDAGTNVLIARSPEVATAVARSLGLNVTPASLLSAVSVSAAANANVLDITVTSAQPKLAARVANGFADQYIAFEAQTQIDGIAAAERDLQAQLARLVGNTSERASLNSSLQRLAQLRAVANGNARVLGQASAPTSPKGMGTLMSGILGALIGLAIGLTIAFLLESVDRRIDTIEGFEGEYRLPLLAGVPQPSFRQRRATERGATLEPYRILRSALDFAAVTRELDSILVTSAVPGEGKTTVAVDLAHVIALTGRSVVLVELDLRRPTFAEQFGLDPRRGLTSVLLHDEPVQDVLVEPFPDLPNFSVLPSGRLPPNPAELIGSPAMEQLLIELRNGDTTLIVDSPPLNPVADAQVLLNSPAIHGAIIVARARSTTRDQVRRARAILDRHMLQPLGIVVTGMRDSGRYGYSSYGPMEPSGAADSETLPRPTRFPARRGSS